MNKSYERRTGVGTRQLSDQSINIMVGCGHNCKYCYAAHKSLEQGKIRARSDWPRLSKSYSGAMRESFPTYDGVVMYPTHHDIEPCHLHYHIALLRKLIKAGNKVLLTTKAHYECVEEICCLFDRHKDQLKFMFTITSLDHEVSRFWEPNAPCPHERQASLMLAHSAGFRTSVIIEPMLEGPNEAKAVYRRVLPYVTDEIWIGKMNSPTIRVDTAIPENDEAVKRILKLQSHFNIMKLHSELDGLEKVQWKDSIIREVEKTPAEKKPKGIMRLRPGSDSSLDEDPDPSDWPDYTQEEIEQMYQQKLREDAEDYVKPSEEELAQLYQEIADSMPEPTEEELAAAWTKIGHIEPQ